MDMPHHDGRTAGRDLTIGEFSRLARLSARMLRHYDARGILGPVRVDPVSGYRYYSAEQLRDAHRITALRDIGLSVAAIAAVLPVHDDPVALRLVLEAQRSHLINEANAAALRIGGVDHLLDRLQEAPVSTPTVTPTTVPAHTVVYLRDVIPTYQDEGALWARFMELFATSGAVYSPTMWCGATFHDDGYRESDVDVELWMDVAALVEPPSASVPGGGTFGFRVVPETETLMVTLVGDYSGVAAASEELGRELAARNLGIVGPMFNIYVVGPESDPDPAKWITQIHAPIAPA